MSGVAAMIAELERHRSAGRVAGLKEEAGDVLGFALLGGGAAAAATIALSQDGDVGRGLGVGAAVALVIFALNVGGGGGGGTGGTTGIPTPCPCKLRLSPAGLTHDGHASSAEAVVAACQACGKAELVVTGDTKQGDADALVIALEKAGITVYRKGGAA